MNEEGVKGIIPFHLKEGLHIVRKTGNNAAHYGQRITSKDANISIKYIYDFLKWFALNYSKETPVLPELFNDAFIPKLGERQRQLKELQQEQDKAYSLLLEQVAKLEKEKEAILGIAQESEATLEAYKQQTKEAVVKLKKQKQARCVC